MRFDVVTLFPEIFSGYLGQSLLKKAKCPFCETAIPGVFANPLK